jgi:uncharacterized membrane protein YqgA involved in biofilm formation
MFGTLLNVAGILLGGLAGLIRKTPLPIAVESWAKLFLGALAVFYGLRLTVLSFGGSFGHILKQVVILTLSLFAGRLLGRMLRLQQFSNRLGQMARERISAAGSTPSRLSDGFKTCTALYCAAPLGIVGSVVDGLSGYFYPLAIKGVVEGLGTLGLVKIFGWGATLSAVAVLAFQGTISLICGRFIGPFLHAHDLLWAVQAVAGMLVFTVALVILQIKRIELADYLPSLLAAPLISAIWR